VRSGGNLIDGESVRLTFHDSTREAVVGAAPRLSSRRRVSVHGQGQGDLF
jgi:hypothetical protein